MPKSKKSRKANFNKLGNLRNMAKSRKAKRQKLPRLTFEDLPNELAIGTFSYLNMEDLINCGQVSKRFRAIVCDEQERRKEDLLKIIQDFQCFKCKRVPGPTFGFCVRECKEPAKLTGDQSKRYLCENSAHILCGKHKQSRKRIWQLFENKCPCGSLVDKNPSQSIAKKLQSLPWMCQNFRWGCREVKVDVKNLETHHGECKFRKVICPHAVEFCPHEVDDGELICSGKKICFKDIFDHLNTVHKDDWYEINGESNKWIESINIEGNVSNGHSWFPSKLTSTNGNVFGLVARVGHGYSTLTY